MSGNLYISYDETEESYNFKNIVNFYNVELLAKKLSIEQPKSFHTYSHAFMGDLQKIRNTFGKNNSQDNILEDGNNEDSNIEDGIKLLHEKEIEQNIKKSLSSIYEKEYYEISFKQFLDICDYIIDNKSPYELEHYERVGKKVGKYATDFGKRRYQDISFASHKAYGVGHTMGQGVYDVGHTMGKGVYDVGQAMGQKAIELREVGREKITKPISKEIYNYTLSKKTIKELNETIKELENEIEILKKKKIKNQNSSSDSDEEHKKGSADSDTESDSGHNAFFLVDEPKSVPKKGTGPDSKETQYGVNAGNVLLTTQEPAQHKSSDALLRFLKNPAMKSVKKSSKKKSSKRSPSNAPPNTFPKNLSSSMIMMSENPLISTPSNITNQQ